METKTNTPTVMVRQFSNPNYSISLEDFISAMRKWFYGQFPSRNNAIDAIGETKAAFVQDQLDLLELRVKNLVDNYLVVQPPTKQQARELIQLFGMLRSSIVHHVLSAGLDRDITSKVPGLDEAMIYLSEIAEHPPRDTYYTYWLMNQGPDYLSFTGNDQELFFNEQVNFTHAHLNDIADLLRPIAFGKIPVTSSSCSASLEKAAQLQREIHEKWKTFYQMNPSGTGKNMDPMYFATIFRTYLPTYSINGVEWGGVNAAHVPSQMQVDYLFGTTNPTYNEIVNKRLRYLTKEHAADIEADMNIGSVAERIITHIGITPEETLEFSGAEVQEFLQNGAKGWGVEFDQTIKSFCDFYDAAAHTSSYHFALIQNYLEKVKSRLPQEQIDKLAVKPHAGTGGMGHAETKAIRDMRAEHPIYLKIVKAFKHLKP